MGAQGHHVHQQLTGVHVDDLATLQRLLHQVQETGTSALSAIDHLQQTVRIPVQFADDHPQVHRFFRDFHADQLFDRQAEAQIHVHRREVIHAVGVGNPLRRRQVFANLFSATMQVADMRRHFVHDFAVGPQQ